MENKVSSRTSSWVQWLNRFMLYAIPVAYMSALPWSLSETGIWIGYGARVLTDFQFVYGDTISFLPTDNNVTSAWLPSILYASLFSLGGFFAVILFHLLVLIGLLTLVYRKSIFRNLWPWSVRERVVIYFFWLGSASLFSARPALPGLVWLVLAYDFIERLSLNSFHSEWRNWIYLFVLQTLWTNTHGSFVLLPCMAAWVLIAQKRFDFRSVIGFFGMIVATLINPFGWRIWSYVWQTKAKSNELQISEWVSPFDGIVAGPLNDLRYATQFLLFWGVILLIALAIWKARQKKLPLTFLESPFFALVIIGFTGLRSSIPIFMAAPLFFTYRTTLYTRLSETRASRVGKFELIALVSVCIGTLLFVFFATPGLKEHLRPYLPTKIQADYDDASPLMLANLIRDEGPSDCAVLNEFNVGGLLMAVTQNPLLIDPRITPFTDEAFRLYRGFFDLSETRALVNSSKACYAVISQKEHPEVGQLLKREFGFVLRAEEKEYVLLKRF